MAELLSKATTDFHVWTRETFTEPRILLQNDRTLQFAGRYVNANDPTFVFTSYSITMCKKDGVSSENLEVMQVRREISFQVIF